MATNAYPLYNGIAPSWANISAVAQIDGGVALDLPNIQAVNTGSEVEVGEVEGGGIVVKRTTGSLKNTASIQLDHDGYQSMLRQLMALAPSRGNQKVLRTVHFDLNIQWTPPGSTEIYEERCKGCFFTGRDLNSAKGSDATMVDVKLNPLQVVDVVDGVEVVPL